MKKSKSRKKSKSVVEVNVGLTFVKIFAIVLVVSLLTAKTVMTIIGTQQTTSEATTSEATYTYVTSSDGEKVPVPVGYTASEVDGETGVDTGFVIYEGDIDWDDYTTDEEVWYLQQEANQYVWVPVSSTDLETMYGVDSNGKYWGKLYYYSSSTVTAYNWTETSGVMSITSSTGYREPVALSYNTAYDIDSKLTSYLNGTTRYELQTQELEDVYYEIIESIRTYGGFYIGRYETGNLSEDTATVTKMNTDINYQTWYVMYEQCKGLSGDNDSVATSMIYGSLWDYTLQWLVSSGATNSSGTTLTDSLVWSNSTTWGNYYNTEFTYYSSSTSYSTTSTRGKYSSKLIGTGSADYTKVNNIYDLAGNVWEWTTEAYSTNCRVIRSGSYGDYGSNYPAGYHYELSFSRTYSVTDIRVPSSTLY